MRTRLSRSPESENRTTLTSVGAEEDVAACNTRGFFHCQKARPERVASDVARKARRCIELAGAVEFRVARQPGSAVPAWSSVVSKTEANIHNSSAHYFPA